MLILLTRYLGKPLDKCSCIYYSFHSIHYKSFFSSLFNSWFLTNWSDLPGLRRRGLLEMEEARIWTMGNLPAFAKADPIGWIARAEKF